MSYDDIDRTPDWVYDTQAIFDRAVRSCEKLAQYLDENHPEFPKFREHIDWWCGKTISDLESMDPDFFVDLMAQYNHIDGFDPDLPSFDAHLAELEYPFWEDKTLFALIDNVFQKFGYDPKHTTKALKDIGIDYEEHLAGARI